VLANSFAVAQFGSLGRTRRIPTMRVDLICFALLSVFGFLRFGPLVQSSPYVMDMWGSWIWAGFCAFVSLLYPLLQTSSFQSQVARFLTLFGRLFVVFLSSAALWIIAIIWLYPTNRDEWQLGVYFVISAALLVALPSFCLGYIVRRCFIRAT
jgi:hypothetical protein